MSEVQGILELQNVSGSKAKQEVLKKYSSDDFFKRFLYYALNPLLTYKLSEKTLKKDIKDIPNIAGIITFTDIFDCCEHLSRIRGIDDATIKQVRYFLYRQCSDDVRELFIKLLAKTIRLGVTAKTVNKVITNLIPEWEVQQAYAIEKYPIPVGTDFWLTQKLNGVRATMYNGQLIARSGVPFKGLEHILQELAWLESKFVLDGELTLTNKEGLSDNEAFRIATGILNSDKVNKTDICFTIFDAIPIDDFNSSESKVKYSNRRLILDKLNTLIEDSKYISVLPVLYHGKDQRKIEELLNKAVGEDKEGLMLNTDVAYKRTRHKGILKIKRFYTMDLPIVRCEEGSGKLEGVLGAFVLDYKGNEVRVGSGFTYEQRKVFWQSRNKINEMICEVKYKEISSDKSTGLESLQFPVFVRIRDDKMEVSYD